MGAQPVPGDETDKVSCRPYTVKTEFAPRQSPAMGYAVTQQNSELVDPEPDELCPITEV